MPLSAFLPTSRRDPLAMFAAIATLSNSMLLHSTAFAGRHRMGSMTMGQSLTGGLPNPDGSEHLRDDAKRIVRFRVVAGSLPLGQLHLLPR